MTSASQHILGVPAQHQMSTVTLIFRLSPRVCFRRYPLCTMFFPDVSD